MIKNSKSFIAVLAVCALIAGISGCKKSETPATDAGKKIDQAVEKAGEKVNAAVEKTGDKVEKAGQKIKEAAKPAKK